MDIIYRVVTIHFFNKNIHAVTGKESVVRLGDHDLDPVDVDGNGMRDVCYVRFYFGMI